MTHETILTMLRRENVLRLSDETQAEFRSLRQSRSARYAPSFSCTTYFRSYSCTKRYHTLLVVQRFIL